LYIHQGVMEVKLFKVIGKHFS